MFTNLQKYIKIQYFHCLKNGILSSFTGDSKKAWFILWRVFTEKEALTVHMYAYAGTNWKSNIFAIKQLSVLSFYLPSLSQSILLHIINKMIVS